MGDVVRIAQGRDKEVIGMYETGATMARETRLILRLMEPVATLLMSNKCNGISAAISTLQNGGISPHPILRNLCGLTTTISGASQPPMALES